MADALGLGNLGINININQWLNTGMIMGLSIVGLIIIAVIMLLVWYITKHDKKVYLFFKTAEGETFSIKENKGEKNIKKRTFKLLYDRKINCTYPESKHSFLKKGKECYVGIVVNDVCTWLTIDEAKLIAPDSNLMNFQVEQYHAIDEATKGQPKFWDKYGAAIIFIVMMTIFFISIIFILRSVDKAIDMGASVAAACQQTAVRAFNTTTQIL